MRGSAFQLFFISFISLLLELLLIRWVGTEINIFAYLQNMILIACFLGLGAGCCSANRPINFVLLSGSLFAITALLSIPATLHGLRMISVALSLQGDFIVWDNWSTQTFGSRFFGVASGLFLSFAVLSLIVSMFVPLGRAIGKLFDQAPSTELAYSINIIGSLVGIWCFVLLSVVYSTPAVWVTVVILLLLFVMPLREAGAWWHLLFLCGSLMFVHLLPKTQTNSEVIWSPYQKLEYIPCQHDTETCRQEPFASVYVNNTGYQWIYDYNRKDPNSPQAGRPPYNLPYLLHPTAHTALIVGAGTGNDVAAANRYKLDRITAVEIDPEILKLGRKYHPEKPYENSRVTVHIDDARAFFMHTKEHYDLIVFGLLDSHTTAAMNNTRLDHFVYTIESMKQARSLLNENGLIVVTFLAQKPFIASRLYNVLRHVFSSPPLAFQMTDIGNMGFVSGEEGSIAQALQKQPQVAQLISSWQKQFPVSFSDDVIVTTDDWPFLYLPGKFIPKLFYLFGGVFIALFLATGRYYAPSLRLSGWRDFDWHFFFLGAAFLLLETVNIARAAVAFGNTWFTASVIFSGILCMILFSNFLFSRLRFKSLRLIYVALIVSCLALFYLNVSSAVVLPFLPRLFAVGLATSLPILFSGLIFISSFNAAKNKDNALGANLLGALLGGWMQSITFIVGMKALFLVAALFYIAAWLRSPTSIRSS